MYIMVALVPLPSMKQGKLRHHSWQAFRSPCPRTFKQWVREQCSSVMLLSPVASKRLLCDVTLGLSDHASILPKGLSVVAWWLLYIVARASSQMC